ncbi:response regulator transcription factor [Larkinella insperata]|uniref:Response regulator transcription factor n=2 Tax=Larkinella insperata TaxID=332158 RepID=A0ABW3Q5K6_9BACT
MEIFKSNVLVVENNRFLVNVLYKTLSDEFSVTVAANGFEAMALLEKGHKVDFIVTDLKLPRFNGLELIQLLRKSENYQEMPILALSESGDSNARISSLESGADDCMEKPFNPFEIQAKIKAMLRRVEVRKPRSVDDLKKHFPGLRSLHFN